MDHQGWRACGPVQVAYAGLLAIGPTECSEILPPAAIGADLHGALLKGRPVGAMTQAVLEHVQREQSTHDYPRDTSGV